MTTLISIILPVFAEGDAILSFHEDLNRAIAPLRATAAFEFIYVVDPAGDSTESTLCDLCACDATVNVIVMSRRFGHQTALLAGMDFARGDAVIMMDSDGQHPVELIADMVKEWRGGAEIVQMVREPDKSVSAFNRHASATFYRWFRAVAGLPIPQGAADFRLISRDVCDLFRFDLRERRMFLRGMVIWVGRRLIIVPYTPKPRAFGTTKYRLSSLIDLAISGLVNFSNVPLRLMVYAGLGLAALSGVGLVVLLAIYLAGAAHNVPGWTSIMFVVFLAFGVQSLFLGIIGEYLAQIIDEVKQRPRYLVSQAAGPVAARIAEGPETRRDV